MVKKVKHRNGEIFDENNEKKYSGVRVKPGFSGLSLIFSHISQYLAQKISKILV